MQKIISEAIKIERNRLFNKLNLLLNKESRQVLDVLLESDDTFYRLTLIKKDPKDFKTSEMRSEVNKQSYLENIYKATHDIIEKLNISAKNIEYYSEMAQFYSVAKLKRFTKNQSRLYLMCYAHQRLLKINERLITFLTYRINKYFQGAELWAQDQISRKDEETVQQLVKAEKLIRLYSNKKISDQNLRPNAFQIVPEDKLKQFARDLTAAEAKKDKYIWQSIEEQSKPIKLNIRPVFNSIQFSCSDKPLQEAIEFLKTKVFNKKHQKLLPENQVPMGFISKKLKKLIIEKVQDPSDKRRKIAKVNINRYEYMVYWQLEKKIESGQVFIKGSINFRNLEDELIPYDIWLKNRDKILKDLNLSILNKPIHEILEHLKEKLTERYFEVNERIKNGENSQVKINKGNEKEVTWHLPKKKQEEAVNNPFYKKFSSIQISDLIRFTLEKTKFDKKLKHIQPHYAKNPLDRNNLIAALLACGSGFGIKKMADISDVNFNELISTQKNYFRLQTLRDANDSVVNSISKLPIFKFYTLSELGIHASVDGQKVETKTNTIKARYSSKYWGFGKGVVSFKLVANNVPINDKIIGANEYEGHYVFDIVYNNSSDVDIHSVSGDMHSVNRVNFGLMYLFGYRFMPRFTHLPKKAAKNLVCFENPDVFKENLIKPSSKVNSALIIKEWDNILRILASLAMKETTQAIVVKKLASYKLNNPTLKALIEFDKIIMSLYMLDYIDDPDMRSNVHRSLNRGESLHQLISTARKVSGNKLLGKTEIEMEMNNECNRLIANCIIYYNATLLSELYKKYKKEKNTEFCDMIKRLSPVAWQHINLVGKYDFCKNQKNVNIQEVIENLKADFKINFL